MSGQTCLLLFMTVAQSAHQITSTDRVCQSFWASSWRVPNSHVEKVSAAMQVPFPELTELRLNLYDYDEWVLDCQSAQSFAIRSWVDPLHVCELSS